MAVIGATLKDKYKILSELGHGGTSVVYLAEELRGGGKWAVKECRREPGTDTADAKAHATLMKSLVHPSIPQVKEFFEDDKAFYIVMDYIPGRSLDKVLSMQGALPQATVVRIGCQLCSVLGHLHAQQPPIICRDIKPSNVILRDEDGLLVSLFDFGIAIRSGTDADRSEKPWGTKGYAAPEQNCRGGRLDARTDIYGLGATMYTLLTGRSPAADGGIYPVRCWNSELSGELEQIILICTQEDPADRYQSCETLRQALLDCDVSQEPVHAGEKQEPMPPHGDERCRHCRYSPLSCAPAKRRNAGGTCTDAEWDRTEDMDATVMFGRPDQTEAGFDLIEAKRRLQFLPDTKIIMCGADM